MISSSASTAARRTTYLLGSALAVGLLLAGCGGSPGSTSGSAFSSSGGAGGVAVPSPGLAATDAQRNAVVSGPAPGLAPAGKTVGSATPAVLPGLLDRSIIRTADVTVRVKDVVAGAGRIETLAAGAGGFVAGEQTQAEPDHPDQARAVITVRVPGTQLPQLLGDLGRLGSMLAQSQSATDVTGAVIDVNARIQSQQASVDRIRALLAQAKTIGQVVEIEGELSNREGALESLKGQAKALADQTSLATVTATLVGPGAAAPAKPKPVQGGFGHGLSKGWKAFTDATTWLLTALGTVLPFLIVAVPLGWAAVVVRRRREHPDQPVQPAPDPA